MSAHGSDPKKVVRAALMANAGIAVAKFVAAFLSESTTMLAEGVHSTADTANQALLWVGIVLSSKRATDRFPFGRASEAYFWSFIVALLLFFLGGIFAIYEGFHKLQHASPVGSPWAPIAVLVVSIGLEGGSFLVALREFQKSRGKRTIRQALFDGKDPVIPVVLLEDSAAVIGLVVALAAVIIASLTGNDAADGIGSIVIGTLLCGVGILLAVDTRSLLIGEGITPEARAETIAVVEATPGVEAVRQLLSLHMGPETVLLALKVRFVAGLSLEEAEKVIDVVEENIRVKLPMMKRIFIEPDSDYDLAKDAEAPLNEA